MIRLSSAALLILAALPAFAQRGARAEMPPVLRKAAETWSQLRYAGSRIVRFRMGSEAKQHTEHVIRDGFNSRTEFPEGSPFSGQVIVETERERFHYFPDTREVHIQPARRREAMGRLFDFRHLKGRGRDVKLTTAHGSVVAGIRTEQVSFATADGKVIQKVSIDPRSGLVLKREMFDHVGTPVGGFEFTRVQLNPPPFDPRVFRIQVPGAKWLRPEELAARIAKQGGFLNLAFAGKDPPSLEHSRVFEIDGIPVLAQIYVSGKGRISLFQTKGEIEPSKLRRFSRGTYITHAWRYQGRNFVLIGELEPAELQRLARRLMDR